ncbi:MAG: hypothetical protein HYU66_26400 [Armatimonadetes bacterium]|nr:hypothetical protein [Armatimonadota bacterium]
MEASDRDVLRGLAARWMELASQPVMAGRRQAWTALKDLHAERPMVLFETWTLEDYVAPGELLCTDPLFRGVEHSMRWSIRQAEELGDDYVLEPAWRVGWNVGGTGYGVAIRADHAVDVEGRSHGTADRCTHQRVDRLTETFGDILPVVLHGTQGIGPGLTGDAFRLIGNDNLLMWPFDHPDALHRLMAYLRNDRLTYYAFLESEGLLGFNHHWTIVGSGSPGCTTALPNPGHDGRARLCDIWGHIESQETTMFSPDMFGEFFLPYMAEVAERFGLVYYGCCEPVHDRWHLIIGAIPHVRGVSISPWCDQRAIADMLGRTCVFSRKPRPAPISGPQPDWDALEQDLDETLDAARDCNLEIVFRDVYRIHGDRPRLRRWADLVRSRIGGR